MLHKSYFLCMAQTGSL